MPLRLRDDEVGFLFYMDCQTDSLAQRLRAYFAAPYSPANEEFKTKFSLAYDEWLLHKARNGKCRIVWEDPPANEAQGASGGCDGP